MRAVRREKLWVVREGDGATVGDIVARAKEPLVAIAEGRVFLGRKRVSRADERVRVGDAVRIGGGAAQAAGGEGEARVPLLFDRDGLVAVAKPAGVSTVPDHAGAKGSLVAIVARQLGVAMAALRVTSRLDREVSGVVVFAKTEEAEARLREARARGAYERRYVALAWGAPPETSGVSAGVWSGAIGRARDPLLREVGGADAKPSSTRWREIARAGGGRARMLAVDPETGRTHQIRLHASHAGTPLFGDRDYGGPRQITLANGRVVALSRIALHAARVSVPDASGRPLVAMAEVPAELASAWLALGGTPDAWNTAISCATSGPEPSPS